MKLRSAVAALSLIAANNVVADVTWSVESGIGYETNVYHAPDHSYIDYAAGGVTINPSEKGGLFVPLKANIESKSPVDKNSSMVLRYRFNGAFYLDGALSDANNTAHKIDLGAAYDLGEKGKDGKAYAGFLIHTKDKTYVDRDLGDPKTSALGNDVSNRYSYTSTGLEGNYERNLTKDSALGVDYRYENRDYQDPVSWTQYDHKYTLLGVYWQQFLQADTKLSVGLSKEVRDFSERRPYDLSGNLVAGATIKYEYMNFEVGARQRFSKNTTAFFDLDISKRTDTHVGYNDMTQTKFKVRVLHDLDAKTRLRGKIAHISRDYANAYNFETAAQGGKSSSGLDLEFSGDYKWSKNKTYSAEFKHRIRDNTDDRYQYNNTTLMLGAKWEY